MKKETSKLRRSRRTTRRPVKYTFDYSSSNDDADEKKPQPNSLLVKKSGIKRRNRSCSHENDIKESALDALYSETSVESLPGKCTQTTSIIAEV